MASRVRGRVGLALALLITLASCGSDSGDPPMTGADAEATPRPGAGAVTALDVATGRTAWSVAAESAAVNAVVVVDGTVLVWGSDECDGGVRLETFAVSDGTRRWFRSVEHLNAAPRRVTVIDDLVVVPTARGLAARRVGDGSLEWDVTLAISPSVEIAADGELVVAGSQFEAPTNPSTRTGGSLARVEALDARDGTPIWSHRLAPGFQLVDVTVQPTGVVTQEWGPNDARRAPRQWNRSYDRADGSLRWEVEVGLTERLWPLSAADGTTIAARDLTAWNDAGMGEVSSQSGVVALDSADGSERWRRDRPGDSLAPTGIGLLDAAGRTVVVRDGTETVALDATTGGERWRTGIAASNATIVGREVLLGSGNAVLFDGETGRERWRRTGIDGGSPAAGDDEWVVLARSGSVPGGCDS